MPEQPKRRRRWKRGPYVPGAYDNLLAPREWRPVADLLAITLERVTGCCELVIVEHTRDGHALAHHIGTDHPPIALEIMLDDGSSVCIDVMIAKPDPILTDIEHTPEDMFLDLRESADLLKFSSMEEPDDV